MELFLYGSIYEYTAEIFNSELSGNESKDVTVRINTGGGSTVAGMSMATKISEVTGKKKAIVDGDAMSMGAFFLIFFDTVEVASTAEIMFHKVAYPNWYEASNEELTRLKAYNEKFKEMLSARLNDKGAYIIDKIFEPDVRNEVYLTPEEAVNVGLASKIIDITPAQLEAAARHSSLKVAEYTNKESNKNKNQTKIKKVMTFEELKSQHPDLYKQAILEERDRVGAFASFMNVEEKSVNERVKNAIINGEAFNNTAMADLSNLKLAEVTLKKAEDENPKEVTVPNADPSKEADELDKTKTPEEIANAKKEAVNRLFKMF